MSLCRTIAPAAHERVLLLFSVDDVMIQFARSSGAGGQNVNKVNTKVDMRLKLGAASWIDEEIREAVRRMVSGAAFVLMCIQWTC